jgi:indoleamine 2,3-dioxygenase
LPSKRVAASKMGKQDLASASASNGEGGPKNDEELKGTGGTSLIPFLKQSRDETMEAGVLLSEMNNPKVTGKIA